MKPVLRERYQPRGLLSVPSTRVYAMKLLSMRCARLRFFAFSTLDSGLRDETSGRAWHILPAPSFSTLDSGLRDETRGYREASATSYAFQYPRLGSTR